MKNILLLIAFLCSSFLIAQKGVLVPPDAVTIAFEKQNPKKIASWSIEYGKSDDVYFEATFNTTAKNKAFALYDSNGVFKSLKTQILIAKLPLKAQTYLKKNYPAKGKVQPVGKILNKIDDTNSETYIAEIKKDKKLYNVVFDKDGEFIKRIEISFL
ncbi:hypothetical protein [Flavobacterium sp. N1736]|uniref:hypothetical protein n=1 Tax=Flavobacterium sp. N1736 TaxID=2986823 RepID=UPI0022252C50|nr:hypothetical protein [Flavobacterium sp. N1736]